MQSRPRLTRGRDRDGREVIVGEKITWNGHGLTDLSIKLLVEEVLEVSTVLSRSYERREGLDPGRELVRLLVGVP